MSVVNLKIIFVEKQKQTRKRPTQGRGATFIITEMAVFTLSAPDSLCTAAPSPRRKIGEGVSVGRARLYTG